MLPEGVPSNGVGGQAGMSHALLIGVLISLLTSLAIWHVDVALDLLLCRMEIYH